MANAFSKEEIVAWESLCEGFEDSQVLSRNVSVYPTNMLGMERSSYIINRPMPYIVPSYDGMDQTANFDDSTERSVPASIDIYKSVPLRFDSLELNDPAQLDRLVNAGKQRLSSDINNSIMTLAADKGTLVVKRTSAAAGFDDVAQCDSLMNEQGVQDFDRYLALGSRDYNNMANNLATRTLGNSPKSLNAYEKAYVGDISGFETFKMQNAKRLTAALGTSVTINGANQYFTPQAVSTASTGQSSNFDNRYQNLAITVGGGTVKVGDCFTIAGVNAVHHITKEDTGQLKTFRITAIVSGAGGSGTVQISPPIISNGGSTRAEEQYQNVTATPANSANLTFLNTDEAAVNPFWFKDSMEILPGKIATIENTGAQFMKYTTEQGFEICMDKQYDIKTKKYLVRVDVFYGVTMKNTEMAGIMLFGQSS